MRKLMTILLMTLALFGCKQPSKEPAGNITVVKSEGSNAIKTGGVKMITVDGKYKV